MEGDCRGQRRTACFLWKGDVIIPSVIQEERRNTAEEWFREAIQRFRRRCLVYSGGVGTYFGLAVA